MSNAHLNPFPKARSPICSIPTNNEDPGSRVVCAIDTIRNASSLLDALSYGLEDSEAAESHGQWLILNIAQSAIAHALQLLEEGRPSPAMPAA